MAELQPVMCSEEKPDIQSRAKFAPAFALRDGSMALTETVKFLRIGTHG